MNNVNHNTGIRFGVITANDVPELHQEIMDNGRNETFEEFKRSNPNEEDWEMYEEDCDTYTYQDKEGEYLLGYLGGAPLIWIMKSPRIVRVRSLCSPCVPNAGDLNSGEVESGGYECYGVPTRWFE